MPAPDVLPIPPVLPHPWLLTLLLDLAKVFGVPVSLFLLARFISLRDKKRENAAVAKEKAAAEETRMLKAAKELADTERAALRAEIVTINSELHGLKVYITEFDKTLDRIHKQLGLLINNYRKLS